MKVGQRVIEVSNPDKVIFPASGIVKKELIAYYTDISDVMLRHVRSRPLTIHRFPDGIEGKNFFQKGKSAYFPSWLGSVEVKKTDGTIEMPVINQAADLTYLANQAAIALHIWLSRVDALYHPDKMIIDLDPPGHDFKPVKAAAIKIKAFYEELGLPAFLMTTGSKGLHIVTPLSGKADYEENKNFAKKICDYFATRFPEEFTSEIRKDKRKGRIYVDYLRNAYGQTGIAPYSLRPFEQAPVAAPLYWDELDDKNLTAQTFNIKNIFKRLDKVGDPWKNINRYGKPLKVAEHKLDALLEELTIKN